MTELKQDLEAIDAEAAECLLDIYPGRYVQYIAARLAELGYVKVVRCGECAYHSSCECEVCKRHGNKRLCCHPLMGEDGIGYVPPEGYCHLGERVVAKDATGEEVSDER